MPISAANYYEFAAVHESLVGTKRTKAADVMMSVVEGKADLAVEHPDF